MIYNSLYCFHHVIYKALFFYVYSVSIAAILAKTYVEEMYLFKCIICDVIEKK